jgi:predicted membrane chloride channel (bestrophin family)
VQQHLGVSFAESNPRKILKRSKDNLGNTPLEVLTYLSAYFENCYTEKTITVGTHQVQATNMLTSLTDVLGGCERVVNTPLPVAYSISISQITWAYVLALPFQLVGSLHWVTIPGSCRCSIPQHKGR